MKIWNIKHYFETKTKLDQNKTLMILSKMNLVPPDSNTYQIIALLNPQAFLCRYTALNLSFVAKLSPSSISSWAELALFSQFTRYVASNPPDIWLQILQICGRKSSRYVYWPQILQICGHRSSKYVAADPRNSSEIGWIQQNQLCNNCRATIGSLLAG